MPELGIVALLVSTAFLPPLVFLAWVRAQERQDREPFGQVLRVFFAGAIFAVVLTLALGEVFQTHLRRPYEALDATLPWSFVLAVVAAPVIEEVSKVLAIFAARRPYGEPEDGLVYGAAAGLGFAATENLFYGGAALFSAGFAAFAVTIVLRSFAASFLHASASAWAGYGVGHWKAGRRSFLAVPLFLLLAVVLHATYNLLATFGDLLPLLAAIAFAVAAFLAVRHRIRRLDGRTLRPSGP